jgi:hypothetical protein
MGWCTLSCCWYVSGVQRTPGTSPDCLCPLGIVGVHRSSWMQLAGAEDGAPAAGGIWQDTLAQPGAPEAWIVTIAIRLQAQ